MVEANLTEEMIGKGAILLRRLDRSGLQPDAAFWFYSPDLEAWKLIIAEVKVGRRGPKEVYRIIQRVLSKLSPGERLSLDDISVATPNHPIVRVLGKAVRKGPRFSGIRFKNNVIDGTLVRDAYIYRMV